MSTGIFKPIQAKDPDGRGFGTFGLSKVPQPENTFHYSGMLEENWKLSLTIPILKSKLPIFL
ncbi:hypothetical protein [Algoriphagus zhangzhouensis]|uniref:hypothetical protein n=1 Tax=Algoriphagus zhangzhouensis TaxID=1073327 RepID=UPI00093738C1|nr:hypothetical protein [Algoriphagus zhangzhouensis]